VSGITCKFGGTSLADAACIKQAANIIDADPERRFIVPSAPGKRDAKDRKITDLLYTWHSLAKQGLDPSEPKKIIEERFTELAQALKLDVDMAALLDEVDQKAQLRENGDESDFVSPDYMASRGEYLNGRLIAALLKAEFVDPATYIKFAEDGILDPISYTLLGNQLKGPGRFVIPGFYGSLPSGRIRTFSRGGSDISGAIVARASGSRLYENWTDVSGFRMADPRVVSHAKRIEEITYQELRELSYMGAKVLHEEAIFPVKEVGIPIQIRNTMEPDSPGTLIVPSRVSTSPVVGVAGQPGFSMINIDKALMNRERAFGRRVLSILEEHEVNWEHIATGIDTLSLIIKDEDLGHKGDTIQREIQERCRPDDISLDAGLAMIATVGQGMVQHIGVAGRLCMAVAEAGVNLRVIDQGSSEMNIIIGVDEADLEKTIAAIYGAFENS